MTLPRSFIAESLKKAGFGYLLKIGFSCFSELGLCSWGRLRADVIACNLKCDIVILEIKSSVADFRTDSKWKDYLPYCNRFFFVFTESVWETLKEEVTPGFRDAGAGVLVLSSREGLLRVRLRCEHRPMAGSDKKQIITRMAWRGGEASKRNSARYRVFLSEEEHAAFKRQKAQAASKPRRTRKTRRRTRR